MKGLAIFAVLQLLDVLTTLFGMHYGAQEASPFIRTLMHLGPLTGLLASKLVAFGIAGMCIWTRRVRVVKWINLWYAGLVIWNLHIIFQVVRASA